MAAEPTTTEAPAKKGGKMKLMFGALVVLALGAGGTAAAMHYGVVGGGDAGKLDMPRLVAKGADDPYAPPGAKDDETAGFVDGEGSSDYRTSYYRFEESFTSNLSDSSGLIQVSLAASTRRDGRVLQWLQRHELAVRSAMLVELANTSEDDAYSVQGKAKLRARLAKAVNAVLEEQEGFGGVDAVQFTGYLVQ